MGGFLRMADRKSYEDQRAALEHAFKGNEDAVGLIDMLAGASQTWDDLIDKDKPVSDESINGMMLDLLVNLPRNPFWRAFRDELQPIIEQCIIDWMSANTLEKAYRHDRTLAFVLRDNLAAVAIRCATIIGGMQWAIEVAPEIRRTLHDEPLDEYLENLP